MSGKPGEHLFLRTYFCQIDWPFILPIPEKQNVALSLVDGNPKAISAMETNQQRRMIKPKKQIPYFDQLQLVSGSFRKNCEISVFQCSILSKEVHPPSPHPHPQAKYTNISAGHVVKTDLAI